MSVSNARVVVIGSANLDLVVSVARLPQVGETLLGESVGRFPGGKGLNQALAAARSGAETVFCAAVGTDDSGDFLQRVATQAGVVGEMVRSDKPTGVAHIFALPDGDNSIVVAAGANGALTAEHATAAVAGAQVVLAQLEVPLPAVRAGLVAARADGVATILNAAPAHPDSVSLLDVVDVLIVNETECEELGGVDALTAHNVTVVLTQGAGGVDLHRNGQDPVHVAAFRIDPVDTTGAGDAFCGAFAAALAQGVAMESALVRANAAGAIVAQHLGASTTELSGAAIDAMVAGR